MPISIKIEVFKYLLSKRNYVVANKSFGYEKGTGFVFSNLNKFTFFFKNVNVFFFVQSNLKLAQF
jgi:hypothetical protein